MYTITDVEDLAVWIVEHFEGRGSLEKGGKEEKGKGQSQDGDVDADGGVIMEGGKEKGVEELWERVPDEELERDPCVKIMRDETEEGKKVNRNGGMKFVSVWRRREDPTWPDER